MGVKEQFRFFLIILGFITVYVGFGFLFALDQRDTSNALYEVFREKALTAKQAPGAGRVLLVGGSNVVWGFRSQIIEDETGISTFNLGLIHEAHDPEIMRRLALSVARNGDILVYSSISFWNSRVIDTEAAKELLRLADLDIGSMSSPYQKLVNTIKRYWSPYPRQNSIITSLPKLYRRYVRQERSDFSQDFNPKGDIKTCNKVAPVPPAPFVDPPDRESLFQSLEAFENSLQKTGASLVLTFPPILVSPEQEKLWLDAYSPLLSAMRERFQVETQTLKDALFITESQTCDTSFHLGNEPAAERSHNLARFINDGGLRL